MPFISKKQAKFAFATKQPWAKEWASKTDFKKLPEQKKKKTEKSLLFFFRKAIYKLPIMKSSGNK